MPQEIYLDNAATTRPHPAVVEAMREVMTVDYGNPSSLHRMGVEAERRIEGARAEIAALLGVNPREIVFTSGATEANNLAIRGVASAYKRKGKHLITTQIEHSSVIEPCRRLQEEGFEVTYLPVDRYGLVDPGSLAEAIGPETILVSVMAVNNEVGSIQPIEEIGKIVREAGRKLGRRILFHVDAVQALGKVPLSPNRAGIDLLSLSGHKIAGPKGIGALFIREGVRLTPLLYGGDQERGLRPGTENVPGIVGMGVAARLLGETQSAVVPRLRGLRARLLSFLRGHPRIQVNGPPDEQAAPHILSITAKGVLGEHLVHRLEVDGIYVSTGSACHSRRTEPSHVLLAMGLTREEALSTIRISFGYETTEEDVEVAGQAILQAVDELASLKIL